MSKYGITLNYNGKHYISLQSLCDDLQLPYSPVLHKYERTQDINTAVEYGKHIKATKKPYIIWGKTYNSLSDIATTFGINKSSLEVRIDETSNLEEIIKTLLQKETITFEGKEYTNISALATTYGMDPSLVIERLQYGLSLDIALKQEIKKRNRPELEVKYHGKTYESKRQLSRELGISTNCITELMQNHKIDYETAVDILHETKQRAGISDEVMISYLPVCIINGKWYKTVVEISNQFKIATSVISTYKYRHNLKGILETLQSMQKETKPAYLLNGSTKGFNELKKLGYTDNAISKLPRTNIRYYSQLATYDLYTGCIDVLKIYTEIKEEKIGKSNGKIINSAQ